MVLLFIEEIALIKLCEGLFKLQANVCPDLNYLYSNSFPCNYINSVINTDKSCVKISKIKIKSTS